MFFSEFAKHSAYLFSPRSNTVNQQSLINLGIGLALVFGSKYVPNALAKTAMVGVGATVIAKQIPIVQDALA